MENTDLVETKMTEITDKLEQIYALNQLLLLHQSDDDDFMVKQYQFKKSKLTQEIKLLMQEDFAMELQAA